MKTIESKEELAAWDFRLRPVVSVTCSRCGESFPSEDSPEWQNHRDVYHKIAEAGLLRWQEEAQEATDLIGREIRIHYHRHYAENGNTRLGKIAVKVVGIKPPERKCSGFYPVELVLDLPIPRVSVDHYDRGYMYKSDTIHLEFLKKATKSGDVYFTPCSHRTDDAEDEIEESLRKP